MFCEKCGKQIEDDSLFCVYCGHENGRDIQPANNGRSSKLAVKKKKRLKKWQKVILVFMVIILLIVG